MIEHILINDQTYLVDDEHMETSYFNNKDATNGYFYHEFPYTFTNRDGTTGYSSSRYYYYTDENGKLQFKFTHAFADIHVYAVYRMVEYDVNLDITAPTNATYFHETSISNVSVENSNILIEEANYLAPLTDKYGVVYSHYYTDTTKGYVYYKCGNKFLNYSIAEKKLYRGKIAEGNIVSDSINNNTIIYGDQINYYGSYDSNNAYDTLTRVDNPFAYTEYIGSSVFKDLVTKDSYLSNYSGLIKYTPKLFVHTERANARFFFNDFVYNRGVSAYQSFNTNNVYLVEDFDDRVTQDETDNLTKTNYALTQIQDNELKIYLALNQGYRLLHTDIKVYNGSDNSQINGVYTKISETTYVGEIVAPSRIIKYEYKLGEKLIYTYTEEEYYNAVTQILSYKYIITFPSISQDYNMSWDVSTLTHNSIDYTTTSNSSAQGYVERGTFDEDKLTNQVLLNKDTVGQFYGNTQYVVFYPVMNTKNNFYDEHEYELDYVDSYLSRIDLRSTNGAYTTLADNAIVSTFFTIEYYLDTATQYQIDFRNFIVRNESGALVNPVADVSNPKYQIDIDRLHLYHGETFADFEPGDQFDYDIEKAFILNFNGLEYYLYLCHFTETTHDYYCYILWADTCTKNDGLEVSTTFTDIKHNTTFASSIVEGANDYYNGDTCVGTTITNNSLAGVASYADSMNQANIYPSDINSYTIRPYSGYFINTVTVQYGNGFIKINLQRNEDGDVIGIDSHYNLNGVDSKLGDGIYTYRYTYTNEGFINYSDGTNFTKTDIATTTKYDTFNNNDTYINAMAPWVYLFHEKDFISYEYDYRTGYITLLIYGIYGDVSIVATAESYVSFRLETDDLTYFYANNASSYVAANYTDNSYKNYIFNPASDAEFVNYLTFGFEFYIGYDENDNDIYNKGWSNEILDETELFKFTKDQMTTYVFGKYKDGETSIYYLEMIYIGKAKIFDDCVTLRTVNYNYTYRMTDFMLANRDTIFESGSFDNLYTTNTAGNTDLRLDDTTITVDVNAEVEDMQTDERSRYKTIFINDLRKVFKTSAVFDANNKFGGYTFTRLFVEPMKNEGATTIGTLVHIDSYLYTQGKGNDVGANKDDAYARLDPIQDNSWFNGHTLSRIRLDYYAANRDADFTQVTYKEFEGRTTEYFYGNTYNIYYTEIEGFTLYKFNYLGTDYYFTYDDDFYIYTQACVNDEGYIEHKTVGGVRKTTLPDSIRITYTRNANETYGVFKFTIIADTNTFRTNFIKFYSKQKTLEVTYKFNKHSSTSPAKISGVDYTSDDAITQHERTQQFFFNEVTRLTPNNYGMVGYTFMGYSSKSDWSNFSIWSRVDNWTIATDTDIYNMNRDIDGTAFFSYNFYVEASSYYEYNPTFVSHETVLGEGVNPYDYNFYNVIKDQIHRSLYFDENVQLYSVWRANKYNIVFDMNDLSKVNPLNNTVSKGSTEAQFNVLDINNLSAELNTDHYDDPFYFINDASYETANAYYENGYTDGYYYNGSKVRISMVVTFDTNDWYLVFNGKTWNLEDILIDRYGYSWYGWFVSTDGKLDTNFARFFNTNGSLDWATLRADNVNLATRMLIISSRTLANKNDVDESNRLTFNYSWITKTTYVEPTFDTSYEYRKNGVQRIDTLSRLDIEYLCGSQELNDVDYAYTRDYFSGVEFRNTAEYEDVYYNHNVYGKFTLYAGWQANTYTLAYDYGTYGIDNNKTNKVEGTNLMHNTSNGVLASAKHLRKTTSPLQTNSGDYNTLIFDVEYNPQYLTRIGYTFMGWRLGLNSINSASVNADSASKVFEIDNSDNSAVTIDGKVSIRSKGSKICINYNSIIINDGTTTTGVTTNCYLYRDMSNLSGNGELLGNYETLGDSESNCVSTTNHYVAMFAMWKTNIYTVKLDVNTAASDTTTANAFLSAGTLDRLTIQENIVQVKIYVIFDTNVWYYEESDSSYDLRNIILEKFGYFFLGWYTDAEAKEGRNELSSNTINKAHYTDFLMTGTDYNYTNAYNTYPDRIDDFDVYIKNSDRTAPVKRLASSPQMRVLDYALFNQFIFRTYGETTTNENLYTFESTLAYSAVNGYTITYNNSKFTSNITDEYSSASRNGNWYEERIYNTTTLEETTRFEITIYAKWQGIIYEISFNDASFGDESGIGTTTAQYITEKNGTVYNANNAKCNIYVMFDKNLYTSSFNEIWQVESDYYAQTADATNRIAKVERGLHLNEIINVDRYGYTWTGWYTRGYEYLPEESFNEVYLKHATNGSKTITKPVNQGDTRVATYVVNPDDGTEYYVGLMLSTQNKYTAIDGIDHRYYSRLITDGHDYSGKTYSSSFNVQYEAINNYNKGDYDKAAYEKFSIGTYSDLQTFVTNKEERTFTFTLYAGWVANTYLVYYESNSNSAYDNDWELDGNTHGLPYVSGAKQRSLYSDLYIGSSPSYKITTYNDVPYAEELVFDGYFGDDYSSGEGYVECTAWQRFGYTFIGYSLGQGAANDTSSAHFYASVESKAKSTLVKLDYYAIAIGDNNFNSSAANDYTNTSTSGINTNCYLYGSYDLSSKTLLDKAKRDYEQLGDMHETSIIDPSKNNKTDFITLGDKTYTYAVVLNAFYQANVYNVGFDSNDFTDGRGSTYAFFKDTDKRDETNTPYANYNAALEGTYIEENCDRNGAITVTFDTADWSLNEENGFAMSDIRADRFGYTWMGWYTRSTCFNIDYTSETNLDNIWKNFYYYLIMTGNSASVEDKIMEKFDYSLFLTYFVDESAVKEGVNYDESTHNDNMNIEWDPDDNSFTVHGSAITEQYNEHLISIFAGWQANTYQLTYYYSDVNSAKNYDNNLSNPYTGLENSYRTTSPVETLTKLQGGGFITTSDPLYTLNRANDATKFFRKEMIFDKEYDPEYLTRIGYTFMGWRFGLNSSEENYTGTFIENQRAKNGVFAPGEKIILDYNSIMSMVINGSATKYESYLYRNVDYDNINDNNLYDIGRENYFRLGTIEELGDEDSTFRFDLNASKNCTGVSFTKTEHTAQLFAMWQNNVYTVEFNVNHDFNKRYDTTGFLQDDSSVANYMMRLYKLATSTAQGSSRQIRTNSVLQELIGSNLTNIGTDVTSLFDIQTASNRLVTTSLITSLLSKLDGVYSSKLDNPYYIFSRADYDVISLEFNDYVYNGNYTAGDKTDSAYKYVAYVTFDTNDWWFESLDGSTIEEGLYFMILQKLGYYFNGWYVNEECADDDMLIKYYEAEGDQNEITGYYDISGLQSNYTYRVPVENNTNANKWYIYTDKSAMTVNANNNAYYSNQRVVSSRLPRMTYDFYDHFDKEIEDRTVTTEYTYGKITTGTWTENRLTKTYSFTLFAKWTNKVYEIEDFDGNKGTGSTYPHFYIDKNISYNNGQSFMYQSYGEARDAVSFANGGIKMKVVFDSNNFYAEYIERGSGETKKLNEYINHIMVDRYGYTWTGWSSNVNDFSLTQAIDGHQPGDMWTYSNDYNYTGAGVRCDANYFSYDILFNAQTKNETERKLTFYATWQANTYALTFDFCDVNSGELTSYGSTSAAKFTNNSPMKYKNIVFDKYYTLSEIPNLERNGYTFRGWKFGYYDASKNKMFYGELLNANEKFILSNDSIFNGNNILLFTSEITDTAVQETFGDMEGLNHPTIIPGEGMTHFVYLFAQWGSIEFTIEFYGNKLTGSTTPYFNTGDGFNSEICDEKVYVQFDTDNYYSKDEDGNILEDNAINNIIVDRYGYTWTGWYFIYQNYANSVIYSDKTKNVYSYFNFSDKYRLIAGISQRADNTVANAISFTDDVFAIIFGSSSHESSLDENYTTIRLYAGWEANEYSIIYNTADAGTDLQYFVEKNPGEERNLGHSTRDNMSVGSTLVNLEQSITQMSGKYFATTIFDNSTKASYFQLVRPGYIFRGWSLFKNETSRSYDENDPSFAIRQNNYQKPSQLAEFYVLNKTYATNGNDPTSCETSNAYLYYFETGRDSYTFEQLGDGETNNERVIVLHACWEARTYLISFNVNNSYAKMLNEENEKARIIQSSTTPTGIENDFDDGVTYNVFVTFDTNDWFGVNTSGGEKVYSILSHLFLSKLGYTWLGWYTTPTLNCDNASGTYISSKVYDAVSHGYDSTLLTLNADTYYNVEQYSSEFTGYIDKNGYIEADSQCYHSGTITLFAGWQQTTYQVEVISRDVNTEGITGSTKWGIGSTPAIFRNVETGVYNENYYVDGKPLYMLNVYFDSNEFYITKLVGNTYIPLSKTVDGRNEKYNLYYLLLDRYGYTWNGYYFDLEATARNQIVPGHNAANLNESPNIYISGNTLSMFTKTTYSVAEKYYPNIETDKKFYIFASWIANEYNIVYDYRDASNKAINATLGSTNANIITTDYTKKLLFDSNATTIGNQIYYYKVMASRIGYDFLGWNLHTSMFDDAAYNGNYPATYSPADKFGATNNDYYLRINNDLMRYNGRMLLYSDYTSDVDSTQEALGDLETAHYITMIAVWSAREYRLVFNANDSTQNNGSTEAIYNSVSSDILDYIYVVFDTNAYVLKNAAVNVVNNQYIDDIIFDRFGYSLLGWSFNKVTAKYINTTPPNYLRNIATGDIFKFMNSTYVSSNVNETNKTVQVYACWEANVYTINFAYNAPVEGNLNPTYSLLNIDSYTSRNVARIIGSTLSTKHSTTLTLTFDEQTRISNISRNGYDFLGYALDGRLDVATIFNADKDYTIITLNNSTMSKDGNIFIYNNGSTETLGSKPLGTSFYSVNLHTIWSPVRYTVRINANTSSGTTQAYVYDEITNTYLISPSVLDLVYYVEFDTNVWADNISFDNNDIAEISLGRIGYTWQGLYPTADCEESTKFLTLSSPNRTTRVFDKDLFDDLESNVNQNTKVITLFAGWETRTYTVTINENLYNLDNEYNDTTSKVTYLTSGTGSTTYDETISVVFDTANWTNLLDRTSATSMDRYGFDWKYLYSTQYSSIGREVSSSTVLDLELLATILYDEELTKLREIDILNFFHEKDSFELFARWNAHKYSVKFNYNDSREDGDGFTEGKTEDGSTSVAEIHNLQFGQVLSIPNMIRTGFNFRGWVIGDKNGNILTKFPTDEELFDEMVEKYKFPTDGIFNYEYLKLVSEQIEGTIPLYYKNLTTDADYSLEVLGDEDKLAATRTIYVYALYAPKEYVIQFVLNDSISSNGTTQAFFKVAGQFNSTEYTSPCTVKFGSNIWNGLSDVEVSRIGYRWTGWFSSTDQTTFVVSNTTQPLLNYELYQKLNVTYTEEVNYITLYAGWEANEYEIVYDLSYDTGLTQIQNSHFDINSLTKKFTFDTDVSIQRLSKVGFDFIGWSFAPATYSYSINTGLSERTSTLSIIYMKGMTGNGTFRFGNLSFTENTLTNHQSNQVVDNSGTSLITHNEVLQLYTNAGCTTYETYGDNATSHYVKLYAVWAPKTYEVALLFNDAQEAHKGSTDAYITLDDWSVTSIDYNTYVDAVSHNDANWKWFITIDKVFDKLSLTNIDRYGYTFTGWYLFDGEGGLFAKALNDYQTGETRTSVLTISLLEQYVEKTGATADDEKLYIKAGWEVNTYNIRYALDPEELTGSNDIYQITELIRSGSSVSYKYQPVMQDAILFDERADFTFVRLGYEFKGFTFVNYSKFDDETLNYKNGAKNLMLDKSNVVSEKRAYLYTQPTNVNDLEDDVAFELYGDNEGENEHYILIYLFWEAIEYSISIALNNSGLYNYNSIDSNYNAKLGATSFNMPQNSTVLNNGTFSRDNYITFKLKFGDRISSAYYGNKSNTLNYLSLNATGYTYLGLNTSPVPSADSVDINLSLEGHVFNEEMFSKLLIYSYTLSESGVTSEEHALLSEAFVVDEENSIITSNSATFNSKTFTLYAQYEIENYKVEITDNDTETLGSGLYELINNKGYNSYITDLTPEYESANNVEFYSNEYAVILPSVVGQYISKIHFIYKDVDGTQRLLTYPLTLNQTTHEMTFDDGKVAKTAVPYLFNSLELYTGGYSNNRLAINNGDINAVVNYTGFATGADYSYIYLKIQNLKNNVIIACEYTTQQYEVEIYKVVVNNITDSDIPTYVAKTYVNYGSKTLKDIMNLYTDQAYSTNPIWYYGEFGEEDRVVYDENDLIKSIDYDKYITTSLVLVAKYNLSDSFETKSVKFYTWNFIDSVYEVYDSADDYVFQGITIQTDDATHESIVTSYGAHKMAVSDTEYEWKWVDYEKTAFSFKFNEDDTEWLSSATLPIRNTNDSIYAAKLNAIPPITYSMGDTYAVGFIALTAEQLLEKINTALGREEYTYSTILKVFEEKVQWTILDIKNEIATVKFIGEGLLNELVITAPILTTDTLIQSAVYAIATYANVSFTIKEEAREYFTPTESTIGINLNAFKDTISFFEPNLDEVTYYDKDEIRYVVLNEAHFNAYNYYLSLGNPNESALSKVITNYGLSQHKISDTINIESGYVFFYYNKITDYETLSIIKVADEFISKNASAIEFYPISNAFSFTEPSISTSTTKQTDAEGNVVKETINVSINIDFINGSYQTGNTVGANGNAYGLNDIKFALLTTNQILAFRASSSKVDYVKDNLNYIEISTDGQFYDIEKDSFIIAYIYDDGEIIAVAPNFIYINKNDAIAKLIYIDDLLFIENDTYDIVSITTNDELYYSNINTSVMFTGKLDADNGYNISSTEAVKFAIIPSTIFAYIANDIYYGLASTKDILTSYIKANIGAAVKILKSNTDFVTLDKDFKDYFAEDQRLVYYLVPFYSDNVDFNNSTYYYYSENFIKISYTAENILEENEIKFFSNDMKFTLSSVSVQSNIGAGNVGGTHTISINTDNMPFKVYDYVNTKFIDGDISLMKLSGDNLDEVLNIYIDSNTADFYELELEGRIIYLKDFTIEQALEYVLYVSCSNDMNKYIFVNTLRSNTVNINDKDVLLGSKFDELLTDKTTGVTITVSEDNTFADITNSAGINGYIVGFILNSDKSFELVTSNLIYYEVNATNGIPYSTVSLADEINKKQAATE